MSLYRVRCLAICFFPHLKASPTAVTNGVAEALLRRPADRSLSPPF
jgi:hypothetical protein